jgi:hypothetical protein
MYLVAILAQAAETTSPETAVEGIVPTKLIWEHITSLGLVEALTFISFGAVCLFYGWRVFKILVTISFALLGLLLGVWANKVLISGNVIWLGAICAALFAFMSIPLMRWGVTLLGAAAGGVLTGGGWLVMGLPERYIWAGALIGVVAGAMISFIVFKIAVMLFTSLGGSALIVVGVLAVLYKYMGAAERLQEMVFNERWFLPVMLLAPVAVGIILQNKFIRGAKDWSV